MIKPVLRSFGILTLVLFLFSCSTPDYQNILYSEFIRLPESATHLQDTYIGRGQSRVFLVRFEIPEASLEQFIMNTCEGSSIRELNEVETARFDSYPEWWEIPNNFNVPVQTCTQNDAYYQFIVAEREQGVLVFVKISIL